MYMYGFDGVWHMGHIPSALFPFRSRDHGTQARPPHPLWYGSKHWTTLGRMQRFYRPWGTEKSQRQFRSYSTAKTLKMKCKLKLLLWRSEEMSMRVCWVAFFFLTSQSSKPLEIMMSSVTVGHIPCYSEGHVKSPTLFSDKIEPGFWLITRREPAAWVTGLVMLQHRTRLLPAAK